MRCWIAGLRASTTLTHHRAMKEPLPTDANAQSRISRAMMASHFAVAVGAVLQMAFVAILARLLGHDTYGHFAAAAGTLRLASYVIDLGIGTLTTRRGRTLGDPTLAALFLCGIGIALVLAAAIWVGAPSLAAWAGADADTAVPLLRALGFGPAIAASGQVATGLLRYDLRFNILALQSLGALVLGQGGVGIPLAFAGAGVWSLVAGALAQAAISSAIAWRAAPHPWRLEHARLPAPATLTESGWFWILRLLDSAGFHALAPLALALAGAAQAGLWDRALAISILPMELIAVASAQVLFPAYARVGADPNAARERWLSGLAAILSVHGALAVLAWTAGPALVGFALGAAWLDAAAVFALLALWGVLRGAGMVNGSVAEAKGALKARAAQQAAFLISLGLSLAALEPDTAADFARIVVAVDLPIQIVGFAIAARATGTPIGDVARAVLSAVLAVALAAAFVWFGAQFSNPAIGGLGGAAIGIATALWFHLHAPLRQAVRKWVASARPIQ